jgi:hypothetical protein
LIYDPVENKGIHTHRGSHSSYDSRRKYLSDAYLEKSPIFEERAQRHNSEGIDGHRGSMFDVLEDWLLSLMSTLVMGFGPED